MEEEIVSVAMVGTSRIPHGECLAECLMAQEVVPTVDIFPRPLPEEISGTEEISKSRIKWFVDGVRSVVMRKKIVGSGPKLRNCWNHYCHYCKDYAICWFW